MIFRNQQQGESYVVVAVSVGPQDTLALLKQEVEKVVCLHTALKHVRHMAEFL